MAVSQRPEAPGPGPSRRQRSTSGKAVAGGEGGGACRRALLRSAARGPGCVFASFSHNVGYWHQIESESPYPSSLIRVSYPSPYPCSLIRVPYLSPLSE